MVKREIETIIKNYLSLLKESGINVEHAYLYGSCARGEETEESDIDIMLVSRIFDTDDDRILSRPWIYTVKASPRIEPIAVGAKRFFEDSGSPLIELVKSEGVEITLND